MDSIVVLPKRIAIEIVKDLDRLDQADSIVSLMEVEIVSYKNQLSLQQEIEQELNGKIQDLEKIIETNKNKDKVADKEIEYWKKQYKKQKRQKFLVGGIGLGVLALLFIAN